tara:strand:- start:3105 stop:5150 length:2046 start_codon:yes stop_codon:yes gene_type:complete
MSAYEKLDKAYADARKELERSLQSVRNTLAAFDDDPTRSSKRQDIVDSLKEATLEKTELEGKVKKTEQLLARYETEVLSWNQLNTAYKKIWGEQIPGYPQTKSLDTKEKQDEVKELRKQKLRRNSVTLSLKDLIKDVSEELEDLEKRNAEIESEISDYDKQTEEEKRKLEDKEAEYAEVLGGLGDNATEDQKIQWLWDNGYESELESVIEKETQRTDDGREIEVNPEGALNIRRKIEALSGGEDLVRTEPEPGELGGRDTIRPEADVLSDSELVREGLDGEVGTGPGAQGPPTNEITDTSDPMQTGLEEGLAAQRDRIEQARGQDRVIDPRQAVPEFGEFPITGGGDDGTPLPETYQDELDAIADALGITGGFGANFFLDRDDMMITHPVTKEKVNILEYIMDEELTGGKEVEELLEQTQWWAETDRQMRAFDLEWNRLGDGTGIPNTSQLGYIQPTINTVKTQLNKLGVELDDKVVNAIAKSAARLQLTGRQLREHLSDLDGFEGFDFDALVASQEEGLLGTYRDDIQKEASKWMISLGDDIDAETMNNMIESFYEGGGTQDDIDMASTYFANQAKALYPTLAPIIDQGISLSTYFLPYKQRVQNLLERQIDFLGTDHGLFDKIISYTGAGEGIPRVATFSEIDRMIKSDRSSGYWETTQAANKSRSLADTVGRMFGAVA